MAKFQTDSDCIRQREYVGITAWHAIGHQYKVTMIKQLEDKRKRDQDPA